MYLPSRTNEELVRYAETAATTDLERELVVRMPRLLDVEAELEKLQDAMHTVNIAGIDFANVVRSVSASMDDELAEDSLLDAVEIFEKETSNVPEF